MSSYTLGFFSVFARFGTPPPPPIILVYRRIFGRGGPPVLDLQCASFLATSVLDHLGGPKAVRDCSKIGPPVLTSNYFRDSLNCYQNRCKNSKVVVLQSVFLSKTTDFQRNWVGFAEIEGNIRLYTRSEGPSGLERSRAAWALQGLASIMLDECLLSGNPRKYFVGSGNPGMASPSENPLELAARRLRALELVGIFYFLEKVAIFSPRIQVPARQVVLYRLL